MLFLLHYVRFGHRVAISILVQKNIFVGEVEKRTVERLSLSFSYSFSFSLKRGTPENKKQKKKKEKAGAYAVVVLGTFYCSRLDHAVTASTP